MSRQRRSAGAKGKVGPERDATMVGKWDLKIGGSVYLQVPAAHIKHWIRTGKLKAGETVVRRAESSGWQKPEEIEELISLFKPCEQARSEKAARRRSTKKTGAVERKIKRILIVDDEEELCSLLGAALSARGFEMEFAHSKKDALRSLKAERPDLVLLDLRLSDGNGMTLLTFIRKLSRPPAVMIATAFGSDETRSEAKKMGACDFLDKPYNEEDVIRLIRKMPAKGGEVNDDE